MVMIVVTNNGFQRKTEPTSEEVHQKHAEHQFWRHSHVENEILNWPETPVYAQSMLKNWNLFLLEVTL